MLKTQHYKQFIPGFSLDKVVVGAYYDEDMQRRIHRFKFVHNHVDRVYFETLFTRMKEEFPYNPDIIVYPPISLRDRIFRGSNHAKFLVEYFWPEKSIEIFCPFQKKFFTSHQSRRTRKERVAIRTEYLLNEEFRERLVGKKILLIDDVITTGYTAHTLGKLLKKAGAQEVVGCFLASEKI
jgi:competence protein ComFC